MARRSQYEVMAALLIAMLSAYTGTMPHQANGQSVPAQQPASGASLQPKSVPLAHLYLFFLIHQNRLDAKAASEEALGRDGKWFRNHNQASLGFSDADYAAIRTSSVRLAAEIMDLDAQATAVRSAAAPAANSAQLKAWAVEREADVNKEILYLKQTLPPEKIAAFETYITQFFAPKNTTVPRVSPATIQPTPTTVQQ